MNRDERIAVVMGALAQAWHLTSPSNHCGEHMVAQSVAAVDKAWTDPPQPQRKPIDPSRLNALQNVLDEWWGGQQVAMFNHGSVNQLRGANELYVDLKALVEELKK